MSTSASPLFVASARRVADERGCERLPQPRREAWWLLISVRGFQQPRHQGDEVIDGSEFGQLLFGEHDVVSRFQAGGHLQHRDRGQPQFRQIVLRLEDERLVGKGLDEGLLDSLQYFRPFCAHFLRFLLRGPLRQPTLPCADSGGIVAFGQNGASCSCKPTPSS